MNCSKIWLLLLWVLIWPACSGNSNDLSGFDSQKSEAREIPLGRMDHGTVDAHGDREDWRYIRIPATGMVEITLSFDRPEAKGICVIRNMAGIQIARLVHHGQPVLKATFRGEVGIYYIEIMAQEDKTPYTLQVDYAPLYTSDNAHP